jgi:hypothetical protein
MVALGATKQLLPITGITPFTGRITGIVYFFVTLPAVLNPGSNCVIFFACPDFFRGTRLKNIYLASLAQFTPKAFGTLFNSTSLLSKPAAPNTFIICNLTKHL